MVLSKALRINIRLRGFVRCNRPRERPRAALRLGSTHSPVTILSQFDRPPSGRSAILIVQHSAQALTALDRSRPTGVGLFPHDQPVVQTLVVALVMIMHNEFLDGLSQ